MKNILIANALAVLSLMFSSNLYSKEYNITIVHKFKEDAAALVLGDAPQNAKFLVRDLNANCIDIGGLEATHKCALKVKTDSPKFGFYSGFEFSDNNIPLKNNATYNIYDPECESEKIYNNKGRFTCDTKDKKACAKGFITSGRLCYKITTK